MLDVDSGIIQLIWISGRISFPVETNWTMLYKAFAFCLSLDQLLVWGSENADFKVIYFCLVVEPKGHVIFFFFLCSYKASVGIYQILGRLLG